MGQWRPGRPEDWEKIKKDACARKGGVFNPDTPVWIEDDLLLFEAGADAMLGALAKALFRGESWFEKTDAGDLWVHTRFDDES